MQNPSWFGLRYIVVKGNISVPCNVGTLYRLWLRKVCWIIKRAICRTQPSFLSSPSGEASAVPTPSTSRDPSKELTGFSPVHSLAPSGEASLIPTLSYPSKELTGFLSPLCIGDLITMGYGYGRQYSCQSYQPLSCGVICSENYCLERKNRKIYLQHQTFAMSAASLLNHQMIHVENSAQFLHQQHQEKQVQYQILLQVMIQARKPQFFLR